MEASLVSFKDDLRKLINIYSLEIGSDTPDYILARFMSDCLDAWNASTNARDKWFRFKPFDNFPESAKNIKV